VLLLKKLLKDSGEGTNNELGARCSRSFWQTLSKRGVTGSKREKDLLYSTNPREALTGAGGVGAWCVGWGRWWCKSW